MGVKPRFGNVINTLKKKGAAGLRQSAPLAGGGEKKRLLVVDKKVSDAPSKGASTPGSSSQDLLSSIKKRKEGSLQMTAEEKETDEGRKMVKALARYIWGEGGRCSSDTLIQAFAAQLCTPEEKFAFRGVL